MTARPDRWEPYRPQPEAELGPLFAVPIKTMARRTDPSTSKRAAVAIADKITALQARVYSAFVEHGAMSAKQAERLPEFSDLGFSTVRKRVSELASREWLRDTGRTDSGCTVYAAT